MKKILFAALLAVTFTASAQQAAQQPGPGYEPLFDETVAECGWQLFTYHEKRYAKLIDLSKVEGLLEPYTYQRDRLQTKDYKGVEVREFVYRTHDGYELKMAVDMAVSEQPTPVVIYCHGGGWARGNNGAPAHPVAVHGQTEGRNGCPYRLYAGPAARRPRSRFRSTTCWPPSSTCATTPRS